MDLFDKPTDVAHRFLLSVYKLAASSLLVLLDEISVDSFIHMKMPYATINCPVFYKVYLTGILRVKIVTI